MTEIQKQTPIVSRGKFRISVAPDMFRMLSANLYSDPIKAIVREYSTNAADSHKVAGNDSPFDVHLPNTAQPQFRIRDYGTGMSREHVETIFNTYGASSKRKTNLATGKFGLGAKSALSYVGSFGLTSYHKGVRYQYVVALDATKVPELLYVDKPVDTEEPDGVEISFGVKESDVALFHQAAKDVYRYFDLKPNFLGEANIEIPSNNYVMEGGAADFRWGVKGGLDRSKDVIVMGGNAYPIPNDLARHNYEYDNVDYYVEVDAFEPTPSRESLIWEDEDKRRFKAMREKVKRGVAKQYEKTTRGMTKWEAYAYTRTVYTSFVCSCMDTQLWLRQALFFAGDYKLTCNFSSKDPYSVMLECSSSPLRVIEKHNKRSFRGDLTVFKLKKSGFIINGDKSWHTVGLGTDISEQTPLHFIVVDSTGLDHLQDVAYAPAFLLGSLQNKTKESDIKKLTKVLTKEKVPHKVSYLSEITKELKAEAPVKEKAPAKKNKYTGVFCRRPHSNTFAPIADSQQFEYYIPFDDENTFGLTHLKSKKSTVDDLCINWIEHNLWRMAKMFGLGNKINICYIRPRFVPNYADEMANLKETLIGRFHKSFRKDWEFFVWLLCTGKFSHQLTDEAEWLLDWFNTVWITDEEAGRIVYPFTSRVLKTGSQGLSRRQDSSNEYRRNEGKYSTMTSLIFSLENFASLYAPWIERFNEEVRSMSRTFSYLFKSREDLFDAALLQGGDLARTYR